MRWLQSWFTSKPSIDIPLGVLINIENLIPIDERQKFNGTSKKLYDVRNRYLNRRLCVEYIKRGRIDEFRKLTDGLNINEFLTRDFILSDPQLTRGMTEINFGFQFYLEDVIHLLNSLILYNSFNKSDKEDVIHLLNSLILYNSFNKSDKEDVEYNMKKYKDIDK
jgi:hypothetical protein